ncbi:hypothetical protein HC931_12930 [Candidatus Gracilibacteria bacterium]|nr:hypothetical protein [Candidatus Gracilibacteria bacterium]NJM90477.1 hypothetical protein [Hydrococcus sp. RU_2_2]NJP22293.1 hypothetical protein [Hydrococcus sp. CRU_1_1]
MQEPHLIKKQQYEKVKIILDLGKQRYVTAGGNPKKYRAGFKEKDYLTDEERQEALTIMRQLFGVTVKDGYAYCQDKSWKLPD